MLKICEECLKIYGYISDAPVMDECCCGGKLKDVDGNEVVEYLDVIADKISRADIDYPTVSC